MDLVPVVFVFNNTTRQDCYGHVWVETLTVMPLVIGPAIWCLFLRTAQWLLQGLSLKETFLAIQGFLLSETQLLFGKQRCTDTNAETNRPVHAKNRNCELLILYHIFRIINNPVKAPCARKGV